MSSTTKGRQSPEVSIADALGVVRRRKLVVLCGALLGLVVGTAVLSRPRNYASTGSIRVQPGNAEAYRTTSTVDNTASSDKIASDVMILQSHGLYMQVAQELNLANEPALWREASPVPRSMQDPQVRQQMGQILNEVIRIGHGPKDEMITVTCTTRSPGLSARIVNTLINDYVSYLFQLRLKSTKRTSAWLTGQLDDLKEQIRRDQDTLVELQGKLGVVGFDPKSSEYLATQSLGSFTKAASDATVERMLAEAKYRFLREADPNLIEGEVGLLSDAQKGGTSLLQSLRTARATAGAAYASLTARFGPNYPEVKQAKAQVEELDSEISVEQRRIQNQAKLAFDAATTNERSTGAEAAAQKASVFKARGSMVQYLTLLNDYDAHRTLYLGLIQRLREAGITSGLEAGEIDIVDVAEIPALPVPPGPGAVLGASFFSGAFLGILVAFTLEALDDRITTTDQAEYQGILPVLASIPRLQAEPSPATDQLPVVVAYPRSRFAAGLQVLRTSLLGFQNGKEARIYLVTSPSAGDGKTITALNLAAVLAQHGDRVLLIDCDYDSALQSLPNRLGAGLSARGLTEVIGHGVNVETAMWKVGGVPDLYLLARGSNPINATVLLSSAAMHQFLSDCRRSFDYVVLDAGPVLGSADALNLGPLVDAALLVVRSGVTTKRSLKQVARLFSMSQTPFAGMLLNDVQSEA